MAQLALAAVGAGVGSLFGQAALGWTVGSLIGSVLFREKLPTVEGPRLTDLKVQSSAYGNLIPIVYGTVRLAGNIIWAPPLIETRHEENVGGKGGPEQTQVTYTYAAHFAVSLCEGPIVGVRKVWADGKLIYNAGEAADAETIAASNRVARGFRVYQGDEAQLPDPLIEAYEGAGNAPAYRGQAYVVFENFQLADYGNRIPNITCEVVASGGTAIKGLYQHPVVKVGLAQPRTFYIDAQGVATVCVPQWASSFDSNLEVKVHTIFPDGTEIVRSFNVPSVASKWFVNNGWSDEPAFSTMPNVSNWQTQAHALYYYRLKDYGAEVETIEITVPANVSLDFNNDMVGAGPLIKRDEWIYGHAIGVSAATGGQIWKVDAHAGGAMQLAFDTAAAGLPAKLWRFFPGREEFYGLLVNNAIAVWDRDFNLLRIIPFTPQAPIVYHASDNPQLFSSVDGEVFIYIWSTRDVHQVLTDGAGRYEYLGKVPSGYGGTNNITGNAWHGRLMVQMNNFLGKLEWLNVRGVTVNPPTLASVVADLCARAKLSDIDAAALTDPVEGYVVSRPGTARAALEPLQQAFFFDAVESGGVLKFVKRGQAPAATIPWDDLAAREPGQEPPAPLAIIRRQEVELPEVVNVLYLNRAAGYQQGHQYAKRLTTPSEQRITLELPIVLSDSKARQVAEVNMYAAWTARNRYEFATSRAWAHLEPTDVVDIAGEGVTYRLRITKKEEGRPGIVRFQAEAEEAAQYVSNAVGGSGLTADDAIGLLGPTKLELLDVPTLRDVDDGPGIYVAARGVLSGWRGAALYRSIDGGGNYGQIQSILNAAVMGQAETVLGAWNGGNVFDEGNSVEVSVGSGQALASADHVAVLNGANAAILGDEVIQFRTATLAGTHRYRLSGLLRGRLGTEWAMASHAIGERFVLLDPGRVYRVPIISSEIGLERLYKAVTFGEYLDQTEAKRFTYRGVNLKCLAPVHLRIGKTNGGDVHIAWIRRTRIGGAWRDFVEASLGETAELYDVEIWDATFTTLKRTFSGLTSSSLIYTSSQITADFGGEGNLIGVRVYQLSSLAGRGYPVEGVFDATVGTLLFQSDGSSLSGWTVVGATVDSADGQPAPCLRANGGQYAYRQWGGSLTRIEFDVQVLSGTTPLCNFFFGCNASGAGQMLRLETRGSFHSGFASTSSWTSWSGPASTGVRLTPGQWYRVKITRSGSTRAWYLNDTLIESNTGYVNNGDYFAIHGDGSTVTGGRFDNIRIYGP